MENYKEKYEAALEKAKKAANNGYVSKEFVEEIFDHYDEEMLNRVIKRYTYFETWYIRSLGETEADRVCGECIEEEKWIKSLVK